MKTILTLILSLTFFSCSKEQQETSDIKITTFLPVGIKEVGKVAYMQIVVDGKLYESKVINWQSEFNLPITKFNIEKLDLFSFDGVVLYNGVGYYDLEVYHIISKQNPLRVNETAFNEIGLSMTVFPVCW